MATKEISEADVAVDLHRHDSKTEGEFKEISRAEERNAQYGVTQRGLKPRHVQLMAIGGAIGVGLWVRPLRTLFVSQLSQLTACSL
jgi:amino acid permease